MTVINQSQIGNQVTTHPCYSWPETAAMGGIMAQGGTNRLHISRRRLLTGATAFGGTVLGARLPPGLAAPGVVVSDRERPQIPCGVMSGDPTGGRAIIWSRTDRPARMFVEYATREDFRDAQRVAGPAALAVSDYTARVDLGQLSPGAQIFYRVTFQDLADLKTSSAPAIGSLRMPGGGKRTITFAYSGDEAGQGWGINPEWGGYRLYETMRRHSPRFFHPFR
jgi:alkaline phosphatase D